MIELLDIFEALIVKFKEVSPKAHHYIEGLPQKFNTPCFLYLLVFNEETQSNYFTKDVTADIQVIYLESKEEVENAEHKFKLMNKLKEFLNLFHLEVKDRHLRFTYHFSRVDNQLAINIHFTFKDRAVAKEEQRDLIQNINMNKEELI